MSLPKTVEILQDRAAAVARKARKSPEMPVSAPAFTGMAPAFTGILGAKKPGNARESP